MIAKHSSIILHVLILHLHSSSSLVSVSNILISKSSEIHNYLKNEYRSLYIETILFYFNQHKVVKDWDLFLNALTSNEQNNTKKAEIKFEFMKNLIDLFDDNCNAKVNNLDDATQILSSFGAILCLLNTNPSSYYTETKCLTFQTPQYLSIRGYYNHNETEFKFQDDSLSAKSLYIFGREGSIARGILGLGKGIKECLTPLLLEPFKGNVLQVACGTEHNLVLDINGNIWAWGDYKWNAKAPKPRILPSFSQSKIIKICVGVYHSFILTEDGNVYSFGRNHEGQLGHGDLETDHDEPQLIEALKDYEIIEVSGSYWHSALISKDGKLFTCGQNEQSDKCTGACGLGKDTDANILLPTIVDLNGLKAAKVCCGYSHTLILTTNGNVLSCGDGPHGALGHGMNNKNVYVPKLIEKLKSKRVIDIAAGQYHSLVVTDEGDLYGFGNGSDGQLAIGQSGQLAFEPVKVEWFINNNIKIISCWCGIDHSAVITDQNELYMFGNNSDYQLGQGKKDRENKYIPITIEAFNKKCVAQVGLGETHSCVVTMEKLSVNNDDNKQDDDEKNNDSAIYLGINRQKQIVLSNQFDDSKQVYGIYIKNEKLFHENKWILITKHYKYS
eukprot:456827_1